MAVARTSTGSAFTAALTKTLPPSNVDRNSSLNRGMVSFEAGRRVHAGAVERGSVEGIHAVLWYADIRGFTLMSDSLPGPVIIDLLNSVFEVLTAPYSQKIQTIAKPGLIRRQGSLRGCPPLPSMRRLGEA
jgi:class 3 adenylate cyclase